MGAHLGSSILGGSTVTRWNLFEDSTIRFVDNKIDIELEISKLILEQDKKKCTEIPSYEEIDEQISKLIQSFEEEERQWKEQGKPSLITCAFPLMSFLLEDSEEEELLYISNNKLGCSVVENIVVSAESNSEAMKGENLETDKLQLQIEKLQSPELKLESGSELSVASSGECSGQPSISDHTAQPKGPSKNATRQTEGAPLPLLKLRISPTPKIVNGLSQLKKKKFRGPSKRLTHKTLKT